MKLTIKKGTTSKRIAIFVQDSSQTDGRGLTGLTSGSAGLAWYYWREDAGNVGGTAVTLAAGTRGTYTSGGFVEKDATNMPGFYEIGTPDAALATGANWTVMILRGATNMAPVTIEFQLTDGDTGAALNDIADALLKRDMSAVTGESARSPLNAFRFLRNKWSLSGTTLTVTKEDDTTSAWTATVSTDAAAIPVVGNDPA